VGVVLVVVGVVVVRVAVGVVAVVLGCVVAVADVVLVFVAGVVVVTVTAGRVVLLVVVDLPKKVVCWPLPVIECPARRSGTVKTPTTIAKASRPVTTAIRQRGRLRDVSVACPPIPVTVSGSPVLGGSTRRCVIGCASGESGSITPVGSEAMRIGSCCARVRSSAATARSRPPGIIRGVGTRLVYFPREK
jgi:hypothetical protein